MGSFDELDHRSLHMLGMHGSVYANYAMQVRDGARDVVLRPSPAELRSDGCCSSVQAKSMPALFLRIGLTFCPHLPQPPRPAPSLRLPARSRRTRT